MKLLKTGFAAALLTVVATFGTGYALAAGKSDAKPQDGKWAGSVGPFELGFKVIDNGKKVTDLSTRFEGTVNCGPPADTPPLVHFPTMAVVKGKFHGTTAITYPSGISPNYSVSGTFSSPTQAGGTMNVHFSFPHNALPPCDDTSPVVATRASK
jgi:hypothetical protein